MKKYFSLFLLVFISIISQAQQKHLTVKDAVLGYYKGLYPKSLSALQWVEGSNEYVYREQDQYVFKDIQNKEMGHIAVSDLKSVFSDTERLPYFQKITDTKVVFQTPEAFNVFDYKSKIAAQTIKFDTSAENQDFCFKNNVVAYTIDNNLYVATASDPKIQVTSFSDKNIVSGQAIHRFEFGIAKGTFWSPKGNYLAFYQKDETHVSDYPLVDVTTYPASLKNVKYPMAGQASEQAKVGCYAMATGKLIYLDIDTTDEHYLTNLSWSPDERYILLAEVNRAQNHMWFNIYDATTGQKVKTLFEEQSDKWVEPETPAEFLPDSNTSFLWLSERDGFMNLYQYDLFSSEVKTITNFDFIITQILGFDKAGHVFVEATGNDPKGLQVYKVNLNTKKVTQITKDGGTHRAQLNENGTYLLDSYSSLSTPRKIGLINIGTKDCDVLLEADNPLKDYKLGTTEFVKLKANNGMDLEARLLKPANFDATKKYPVMVYVYGGPHAQLVTDTFLGGASLCMNYLAAEEDYIVFTVDGRGSGHRGFAFETTIHRNQGVVAMEDQLTGVEYLSTLPYVDTDRMAIFGWSYGGFMTTSMMLRHPGVFTTGVAGGPVIDWKFYEVMYGERYMDTPQENPEGYASSSLPQYIDKLKGDLLIIHGSVDDVVVPQHSMTLLKAAVEKGVPIDFFTYPMHKHNVRGMDRVHLMEKVVKYILEHNK